MTQDVVSYLDDMCEEAIQVTGFSTRRLNRSLVVCKTYRKCMSYVLALAQVQLRCSAGIRMTRRGEMRCIMIMTIVGIFVRRQPLPFNIPEVYLSIGSRPINECLTIVIS